MTNNKLNSQADFNPAKHQKDAGFSNQEPTRGAEQSDVVFLSMAQAAKMTGYHQDYLGQMARSGKLEAFKVGRNWQTTKLAIDKMLGRVPKDEPAVAVQPAAKAEEKAEEEKVATHVMAASPIAVAEESAKQTVAEPVKAMEPEQVKVVIAAAPKPVAAEAPKNISPDKVEISKPAPIAISKVGVAPAPQPKISVETKPGTDVQADRMPVARAVAVHARYQQPKPATQPVPEPTAAMTGIVSNKVSIKNLVTAKDAGPNLQEAIASCVSEDDAPLQELRAEIRDNYLRWNKLSAKHGAQKNSFAPHRLLQFAQRYPEQPDPAAMRDKKTAWAFAVSGVVTIVLVAAGYFASTYLGPSDQNTLNGLVPTKMVAGESTSISDPVTGKASVAAGSTEYVVRDENITSDSTILITLREDFEGRYWVTGQRKGEFTLKFSSPVKIRTPFDYMILADEGGLP